MDIIRRLARPRYILGLLAAVVACQGLFALLFTSLRGVGVPTTLDMMTGFTYAQAREHVALYTTAARTIFNWFQLVDLVFPFAYGLFLSSLITRLVSGHLVRSPRLLLLNTVPLAAAAFDLLENAGSFAMIRVYPGPFRALALATSMAGVAKFALIAVAAAIAVVITAVLIAARLRGKPAA